MRLVEPVVRLVVPVVPIAGADPQGSEQVVVQLVPPEQLALLRQLLVGLAGGRLCGFLSLCVIRFCEACCAACCACCEACCAS